MLSKDDQYHNKALAFWPAAFEQFSQFVVTSFIVSETYTFLRQELSYKAAWGFLERTEQTPRLEIIRADAMIESFAKQILEKYQDQDFSYTDAVSFAVMKSANITEAFTFDHHFSIANFTIVS